MTLKKLNKSCGRNRKEMKNSGQSIFEYLILTTVVVAVVLFFASSNYFTNIKHSCQEAFDRTVEVILE